MQLIEILVPSLTAIIVALGVAWRWFKDREGDRVRDRQRLAALYVIPFVSACEDLQSRLYNILVMGGLKVLRKRYPDRRYAEEVVYLIVRYLAWQVCVSRYGSYTHDANVIKHTEAVKDAFATSRLPLGAFCFIRSEQRGPRTGHLDPPRR